MALRPPLPSTFYKDPAAVKDYGFDLGAKPPPGELPYLEKDETVITLSVTTSDAALVVNSSGIIANSIGIPASQLVAWFAGGVASGQYEAYFLFTTSMGRTDKLTAKFIMT